MVNVVGCTLPTSKTVSRAKCELSAQRNYHSTATARAIECADDCNSARNVDVAFFILDDFCSNGGGQRLKNVLA
jgi:hypothetical protein